MASIQKPSIPKGTRDFGTLEMSRRNYIFNTIKDAFRLFGYRQIETPSLENLSTLMGKYGEEGDRLLFKVLNSGDFMKGVDTSLAESGQMGKLAAQMCEKGLRYDLTVPFARFVVQHRNDLKMPFKRYQIQPVWRADRPQKGRYREFYQCDADVVGSDSLLYEIELVQLIDMVMAKLGINVMVKLNNRKILAGIAEVVGYSDKLVDLTVAIDKIDKIGIEKVTEELAERGLDPEAIEKLKPILAIEGDADSRLNRLSEVLKDSATGMKGIEEMREVLDGVELCGHKCKVELDVSLARGLNYYTGTILEVKALDTPIGSITGGGRYDNLTGIFGMPGLSGVGISFGADRIYDVMDSLGLFPEDAAEKSKIIFVNLGGESYKLSLKTAKALRDAGISSEIYPSPVKVGKQYGYANDNNIPFVGIIGETELKNGTVTLKDMGAGKEETIKIEQLPEFLS